MGVPICINIVFNTLLPLVHKMFVYLPVFICLL